MVKPLGPDGLELLILRIHAAPLQPTLWAAVVEEVRCLLGAQRALLHAPTPRNPARYWCVPAKYDSETLAEYARNWVHHDPWSEGARSRGLTAAGMTYTDDAVVDRRDFLHSGFFNDFLKPREVDRLLIACLDARQTISGASHTLLGLYRAPGREAFSERDVSLMQRLAPHLVVATRNHWSARALMQQNEMSQNALDCMNPAVIAVDAKGGVMYANRSAEALLHHGEWLRTAEGRLLPGTGVIDPGKGVALLNGLRTGLGGDVTLRDTRGNRAILRTVPILPTDEDGSWVFQSAAGLVWFVLEQIGADAAVKLAQLFNLTAAETRILQQLAHGRDLREAANCLGVSIHTARNQLKAVLTKTGCRSQSRLLALVARMAALP